MPNHLLIIEANTTGTGLLALQKALALRLNPIFLTNNPQRYPGIELIDCPIIVCDTNSLAILMQTITTHIGVEHLLGITTTSEFYLETVAALTATYHLPGNSPTAVSACRNKALTRQHLQGAGILQPAFVIVPTPEDMTHALEQLHPPYVVKPADDTGSKDVLLCQSADEALKHAKHIHRQQTNIRGQCSSQTILIEQFIDAPEYSVETFTWKGKTFCIGITEKTVIGSPYFVESQHIFPSPLAGAIAQDIEATVLHTLEILGITHGAAHTEVKLTDHGCVIIEVNARLAGGMIPELIRYVTGIDVLAQQLKAAVNETPEFSHLASGFAGICFLLAHKPGIWQGTHSLERAQALSGIQQITIVALPGKKVSLPQSAYDRLGYVLASAPTYTQVTQVLQRAIAEIEVCIVD